MVNIQDLLKKVRKFDMELEGLQELICLEIRKFTKDSSEKDKIMAMVEKYGMKVMFIPEISQIV